MKLSIYFSLRLAIIIKNGCKGALRAAFYTQKEVLIGKRKSKK